jgi:guanylate kinase
MMDKRESLHSKSGRLFVVSGPSGVGKDTLLDRVLQELAGVTRSISATTRPPRQGETDGKDYLFWSKEEFETGISENAFLEYALYGSNYYGTPRANVEHLLSKGVDVILKIEVQGAIHIKEILPKARLIFLQPPTFAELERRLRSRQTEEESKIQARLAIAKEELAQRHKYHYLITNDDLEQAIATLKAILIAERCRVVPESE